MSTVRDICTRALRRSGVSSQYDNPSAEDMAAALAHLNEMTFGWAVSGVDILQQSAFALGDTFRFWVPPLDADAGTISAATYQGAWNASTNSPSLVTATGTNGGVYRVTVAGNTTLDDVTSWAVDDFAVFNGLAWLKGIDSTRFNGGIIAMLAVRVGAEFASTIPPQTQLEARSAWSSMLPYYAKPPLASFDGAIIRVPSRTMTVSWETN